MKVSDFLDRLLFKLGEGDLHFVATQLKSYFHTIQKDNFWIEESEKILDSLKDVETNPEYTHLTKELRIEKVKENLTKIISGVRGNANTNGELVKLTTKEQEEQFESLINLQEGTISVKSKGGKGTINQSGQILFRILFTLAIFSGIVYYFTTREKPKVEITNCDCSELKYLKNNALSKIKKNKTIIDSLNIEINKLESKGLTEARIQQKAKLLKVKRTYIESVDSIEGLFLPEINSITSRCPFQDCNNSIKNISNKTKK